MHISAEFSVLAAKLLNEFFGVVLGLGFVTLLLFSTLVAMPPNAGFIIILACFSTNWTKSWKVTVLLLYSSSISYTLLLHAPLNLYGNFCIRTCKLVVLFSSFGAFMFNIVFSASMRNNANLFKPSASCSLTSFQSIAFLRTSCATCLGSQNLLFNRDLAL